MFEYTSANHFRFGYVDYVDGSIEKIWFQPRPSPRALWTVEYGRVSQPVADFRTECLRAAEEIYAKSGGLPIDIFFSGGADSEVIVRCFHELKIPFRVHIMRFRDNLNAHDWSVAYAVCQSLNIWPVWHDIDLLAYWNSDECLERAELSHCPSPRLLTPMWLMDQVDGIPIMGSGEAYTARLDITQRRDHRFTADSYDDGTPWVLYELEKTLAWWRYPMARQRPAVPGFFQYTPGQVLSFLQDTTSLDLHANRIFGKLSNKSSKLAIYQKYWPELVDRQKWHGFELVNNAERFLRLYLKANYGDYEHEYWANVDDVVRYLQDPSHPWPLNSAPMGPEPSAVGVENYQDIGRDIRQRLSGAATSGPNRSIPSQ